MDAVNAALIRKALTSNALLDVKVLFARIRYTGSALEIVSTVSSSQLVSGNLAFSTNKITVALTGYTAAPVVLVSQSNVTIPYHVQAFSVSSGSVEIRFYDMAGVLITTQDTSMDCHVIIIGV